MSTKRMPFSLALSIPFDDRQTDPTFIEEVMDEVWDMVKRVRLKSGPRQQTYSLSWPMKGQAVEIIVRRVDRSKDG